MVNTEKTYPIFLIPDELNKLINFNPNKDNFSEVYNPPQKSDVGFFYYFISWLIVSFLLSIPLFLITTLLGYEFDDIGGLYIALFVGVGFFYLLSDNQSTKNDIDIKPSTINQKQNYINNKIIEFFKYSDFIEAAPQKSRKGFLEKSFFEYLIKYFGKDNIIIDSTSENVDYYEEYSCDFILFDKDFNIKIDIEIDEPYILDTREPIHYIGADDKRNEFFLEARWLIIRFCEEQIQKQPDSCCKYIFDKLNTIYAIIDKGKEDPRLIHVPNITLIPQWSKEDSSTLEYFKHREYYLNTQLKIKNSI